MAVGLTNQQQMEARKIHVTLPPDPNAASPTEQGEVWLWSDTDFASLCVCTRVADHLAPRRYHVIDVPESLIRELFAFPDTGFQRSPVYQFDSHFSTVATWDPNPAIFVAGERMLLPDFFAENFSSILTRVIRIRPLLMDMHRLTASDMPPAVIVNAVYIEQIDRDRGRVMVTEDGKPKYVYRNRAQGLKLVIELHGLHRPCARPNAHRSPPHTTTTHVTQHVELLTCGQPLQSINGTSSCRCEKHSLEACVPSRAPRGSSQADNVCCADMQASLVRVDIPQGERGERSVQPIVLARSEVALLRHTVRCASALFHRFSEAAVASMALDSWKANMLYHLRAIQQNLEQSVEIEISRPLQLNASHSLPDVHAMDAKVATMICNRDRYTVVVPEKPPTKKKRKQPEAVEVVNWEKLKEDTVTVGKLHEKTAEGAIGKAAGGFSKHEKPLFQRTYLRYFLDGGRWGRSQ